MIPVPSRPMYLVTTISCPGAAPLVDTSSSSFTLPTPVTEIRGCLTASVTSVCPPITAMPSFTHSSCTSADSCLSSFSFVSGGSRTVSMSPTGSAPEEIRSLAVICTASLPASLAAPVIGSVESTNTSPSSSFNAAQSSPMPGPIRTSSRFVPSCSNITFFNVASGIFPIFMIFP